MSGLGEIFDCPISTFSDHCFDEMDHSKILYYKMTKNDVDDLSFGSVDYPKSNQDT